MASKVAQALARKAYQRAKKKYRPGARGGHRFKALATSAEVGGATSGEKVAGKIFWEKYGKKRGSEILRRAR